jgi:hypothetical protein
LGLLTSVTSASLPLTGALHVLDRLRHGFLILLGPARRSLICDREVRVATMAALALGFGFLCVLTVPLWLLALGPIVMGVPHVVSDIRYLVVQPGLHRRRELWLTAGAPLLMMSLGLPALGALMASMGYLLATWSSSRRHLGALVLLGSLLGGAFLFPLAADTLFAHLHNVIGVLVWLLWRRRERSLQWGVVAAAAILAALILFAPLPVWTLSGPGTQTLEDHAALLAPGFSATWGMRLVLFFAFAQSLHYGVWLRLVPDEARPRHTPRTFTASWQALRLDLGAPLLGLAVLSAAVVVGWACFNLAQARTVYLAVASFHGGLEVVTLTLWFVGAPRAAPVA